MAGGENKQNSLTQLFVPGLAIERLRIGEAGARAGALLDPLPDPVAKASQRKLVFVSAVTKRFGKGPNRQGT